MKIYLDTSVISALFDERNPERKKLTEEFFQKKERFSIFISEITIIEIERTPDIKLKENMQKFIRGFNVLSITEGLEDLAKQYVDFGAVPKTYQEDAYHIALAVLHDMNYLLSWNFRHIVREKTRDIVRMVNTINNLIQVEILTPAELL